MKVRFEIKQQGDADQIPIVMVHGDEANYLIPKYLDASIPFYIFKHMGIEDRKFPYTSIPDIASQYVEKLNQVYPKGTFLLSGYSIGGVIAYEMAQQFQVMGRNFHLVLLDSKCPRLESSLEYHNRQIRWNDSLFAKIYKRYSKKLILALYQVTGMKMTKKHFYYWRMQQYRKARKNYYIVDYYDDLTLIKTIQDNFQQPNLGWSKFVKGHIYLHHIDCSHHQITQEPCIQKTVNLLEQIHRKYNKKELLEHLQQPFLKIAK